MCECSRCVEAAPCMLLNYKEPVQSSGENPDLQQQRVWEREPHEFCRRNNMAPIADSESVDCFSTRRMIGVALVWDQLFRVMWELRAWGCTVSFSNSYFCQVRECQSKRRYRLSAGIKLLIDTWLSFWLWALSLIPHQLLFFKLQWWETKLMNP